MHKGMSQVGTDQSGHLPHLKKKVKAWFERCES